MSNQTQQEIFLSIVINSRNDDHGGRLLERLQTTINWNAALLQKLGVQSEIIVVDYNPPNDRPLLSDVLTLDMDYAACRVRELVVPASVHSQFPDHDHINIYVLLAQNIGIRRARGKYVASIMSDVLLSEDLVKYIVSGNMNSESYYRADRVDIDRAVMDVNSHQAQDYIDNNILQIQTRYGRMVLPSFTESDWRGLLAKLNRHSPPKRLHTNACGDFIMMKRDNWCGLHGFPEIDVLGRHVDAIFCHMANKSGLKEIMIGEVYHIDHDSKWQNPNPTFIEKVAFKLLPALFVLRSKNAARRIISFFNPDAISYFGRENMYEKIGIKPINRKRRRKIIKGLENGEIPYRINSDDWGLQNADLIEFPISHNSPSNTI